MKAVGIGSCAWNQMSKKAVWTIKYQRKLKMLRQSNMKEICGGNQISKEAEDVAAVKYERNLWVKFEEKKNPWGKSNYKESFGNNQMSMEDGVIMYY